MLSANYNDGFKARMIQRLTGPNAMSAMALARESGVSQPTLSRWLREARRLVTMKNDHEERHGNQRRPKDWTIEEKLKAVIAAAAIPDAELGEFLRKNGLHEAQIKEWRRAIQDAFSDGRKREERSKSAGDSKKISQLEKELLRKDRALAEVTALLALKKKLNALWGEEDGDTSSKKET